MATHAIRQTQDQNFSVHFDGVKTNGSTVQKKKGGLVARKALNDISNSGLHTSRKQNPKNGEDLGVFRKSQVSGRKALGDLTNSMKPISQQKSLQKKKPINIAEEGFLHNHEECVKSQKKALDLDFDQFLKTIGLHEEDVGQSVGCNQRKSKDENGSMFYEMEEMLESIIEDEICQSSPIIGSPNSPRKGYMMMNDYDEFPSFILAETPPKRSNY